MLESQFVQHRRVQQIRKCPGFRKPLFGHTPAAVHNLRRGWCGAFLLNMSISILMPAHNCPTPSCSCRASRRRSASCAPRKCALSRLTDFSALSRIASCASSVLNMRHPPLTVCITLHAAVGVKCQSSQQHDRNQEQCPCRPRGQCLHSFPPVKRMRRMRSLPLVVLVAHVFSTAG